MRVLITGAAGYLGSAVARAALRERWQVRALVGTRADTGALDGMAVERVRCDRRDHAALAQAMAGCDAVFHVAQDGRMAAHRPVELYAHNVEATRHVMTAARSSGVARVVYTSTTLTLGCGDDGQAQEQVPVTLADMPGHYPRSKYLAEAAVRELAVDGPQAVIVHAPLAVGPRDLEPSVAGRVVLEAACGRMPIFMPAALNIAHVDDIARGHVLACLHGRAQHGYALGGENIRLREALALVAELVERPPPKVEVPAALVRRLAPAHALAARLVRRDPIVTAARVRALEHSAFVSNRRACEALGYRPRPVRDALADAIAWFYAHRYLPAGRARNWRDSS